MNETEETLVEARRLLTAVGWVQGRMREIDEEGNLIGFCLNGAISEASGNSLVYDKARSLVRAVINPANIPLFNDFPSTTKKMVLEALDKAIEKAIEKAK